MQKIVPCLWFDDQAEQAVNFYISVFEHVRIINTSRYDEASAKATGQPAGSVLTMIFELSAFRFMALNGGAHFKPSPAVSFILNFDPSRDKQARQNLDAHWQKLSQGAEILMPLDSYPFSPHYGWLQDKYGISWQLILSDAQGDERPFIVPSMMFVNDVCGKAEEAADFYRSLFKNTKQGITARYLKGMEPDKEGSIMFLDFMIEQQWFAAMDSARVHDFSFNEALSFVVNCDSQNEIDYYWKNLTSGAGRESMCGWLKDKYGLSWQIVPSVIGQLLSSADPQKSKRVMEAVLLMKKLDLDKLQQIYNQE